MNDTSIPRFREHKRKTKAGEIVSHFYWDGRGRGIADVPLGKDRAAAIEAWKKCEQGIFPQRNIIIEEAARARKLSAIPKVLHFPREGRRRNPCSV